MEPDDKEVIDGLRRSDEKAFNVLFDRYHARMYAMANKILRSGELAEEVVHDAFLKVWERRLSLDPERSIKYYLLQICKNLVLDILHARLRENAVRNEFALQSTEVDNSTEEGLQFKEFSEIAIKAIEALPPQRKTVYKLCKLEGKTYEEAAMQLGISIGTVRDHMLKASKLIRQTLSTYPTIVTTVLVAFLSE